MSNVMKKLNQVILEDKYDKKNLRKMILSDILTSSAILEDITQLEMAIRDYWNVELNEYYDSQIERVTYLQQNFSAEQIAFELAYVIFTCNALQPIQGPAGQLAAFLGYEDIFDGVKTAAELIVVAAQLDLCDVETASINEDKQMSIISNVELSDEVYTYLDSMLYLPPSLVQPKEITANNQSGYLDGSGSIILGQGNHHDYPLDLDAINILSAIPLALDTDIISTPELPSRKVVTKEQLDLHNTFVRESQVVFDELLDSDNEFYLTWKYDKRGRAYSQGYHVNIQGTEYRKAMINLANKELIV